MQGIMPWNFVKKSLAMPPYKSTVTSDALIFNYVGTARQYRHTVTMPTHTYTYIYIYIKRDHRVGMKR